MVSARIVAHSGIVIFGQVATLEVLVPFITAPDRNAGAHPAAACNRGTSKTALAPDPSGAAAPPTPATATPFPPEARDVTGACRENPGRPASGGRGMGARGVWGRQPHKDLVRVPLFKLYVTF